MSIELPKLNNDVQRSQWFDKIAIWDLSSEQKTETAKAIIDDVETGVEYWSSMFLSAVIATLGLLINSTPVVIGAMLIAPIMQPIQAVSFATSTGNRKLFIRSLWLLILSTSAAVACAIFMTTIVPFSEVTNEIAMRTQPTLLDLFIAAASGVVAFLAFGYEKLAKSLAGVAMAASLVPPMCVIGIGVAFGSWGIGRGSSLLFLTNLVAIIIAGICIFFLFGFHPNAKGGLKTSIINSASALIMLLLLSIPLASSLVSITKDLIVKDTITGTTKAFYQQIDGRIDLQSMEYEKILGGKSIAMTIRVPQDKLSMITPETKQNLTKELSEKLDANVELELTVLPITSVYVEQVRQPTLQETLAASTQTFLDTLYRTAYLLNVELFENQKNIIVATFYTDDAFDRDTFRQQYEEYMKDRFATIELVLVNWQEQGTPAIPVSEQQLRIQDLSNSFTSFFPDATLHRLTLDEQAVAETWLIDIRVSIPKEPESFATQMQQWKIQLEQLYTLPIKITTHTTYLETDTY